MKKLFKTTISVDILSTAESSSEAQKIAKANVVDEIEQLGKAISVEVKKVEDISEDWRDCIPFSNSQTLESKTCKAILSDIIAATPLSQKIVEVTEAPQLPKRTVVSSQEPNFETIKEKPKTTTTTTLPPEPKAAPKIDGSQLPKVRF